MSDDVSRIGTPGMAETKLSPDWARGFSPLPTGTRIGELTIQSVLGAGEFGITYVSDHAARNKRYALKEYFPRSLAYRDGPTVRALSSAIADFTWGLDRFLAEARALQKVRHPAIIAVHGVTEIGGSGYVGMAYEQGRDFNNWLHELQRVPTQDEIDRIVVPLLQGLEAVHAAGLFHQDITPDCILIRDNDTPVLVDFGAYRASMRRRAEPATASERPYAAPELIKPDADEAGPAADIYGLAGVLYRAVTGKAPPSAHERLAGAELASAAIATEGRYRSDFLAAIDAGLQLPRGARPIGIAHWREQMMRTQAAKIGVTKPAVNAAAEQQLLSGAETMSAPRVSNGLVLDDDALDEAPDANPTLMENQGFRTLFYGIVGLLGGAIGGALSSVVVATVINPECTADSCVGPVLPVLAAIGAIIGTYVGARIARTSTVPKSQHFTGY
ncbi:MAG: serine/threonine-protein kinase [Hyphomicrobiaceae bacterium]